MRKIEPSLGRTIAYYDNLLNRYAKKITGNTIVSACLVKQVLETQYEKDRLQPSAELRKTLKNELRTLCLQWKNVQASSVTTKPARL